jgi:hypothetical protein
MDAKYGMNATELVEFAKGSRRNATSERKPRTAKAATELRNAAGSCGKLQSEWMSSAIARRASAPT